MERFQVRSYGKGELAQAYCPEVSPAAARRKLMCWINMQPSLVESLRATGLQEAAKNFTPAQVRLIVGALGEP